MKNSSKRILTLILVAMAMLLLPLLAMAADISDEITIDSIKITYLKNGSQLTEGSTGTIEAGDYTVEIKWSTNSHSIAAGDSFAIDIDFHAEMYGMSGVSAITKDGETIGNMKWEQLSPVDDGKYRILVTFTKAVTGTNITGTNTLFFGYDISNAAEDEEFTWEFTIGTFSFEFSGKNGASSEGTGEEAALPPASLYKTGSAVAGNKLAAWTINVNLTALELKDLFGDGYASINEITITDTLSVATTRSIQTMSPYYNLLPDFDKYPNYSTALWGTPKTDDTIAKVDTANGYFGNSVTAAAPDDAYLLMYTISQSDLEALWAIRYNDELAAGNPDFTFNKDMTRETFQYFLKALAMYKSFPVPSGHGYVETCMAFLEPLDPAYVKSISVTTGSGTESGGFEAKLAPEAIDGKMLIILYCTDLHDDGTIAKDYVNTVKIAPKATLQNDTTYGWVGKTWGSGTVTAQNDGIVLKKADQDGNLISDPNTAFSLMRYRGTTEDTGHGSASSWTLSPTGGTIASASLFPEDDTYFKLTETTAPSGYNGISTPIYFKLLSGGGGACTLVLGTVDAGVFTAVGTASPYEGIATIDAANRVLTVINTTAAEPKVYDASLQKWVYQVNDGETADNPHDNVPVVRRGDLVTYAIRVTNVGEEELQIMEIGDYPDENLLFEGTTQVRTDGGDFIAGTWTKNALYIAFTPDDPLILAENEYADILIELTVSDDAPYGSTIANTAAITGWADTDGEPVTDNNPDNDSDSADIIVSPPEYDAALQKWVYSVNGNKYPYGPKADAHTEKPTVSRGDTVTFAIRVINQCDETIKITEIADYFPTGLVFAGAKQVRSDAGFVAGTWDKSSDSLAIFTPTAPITLAAGASADILISFEVSATATYGGDIRNFAEISGMTDEGDNPINDADSLPDSTPTNDGTPKDNVINEKRYVDGNITDPDDQDEDDHDYADIKVENEPQVPEDPPEEEEEEEPTTPTVPPTTPTTPPTVPTTPPTTPVEPPTTPTTPPTTPVEPPTVPEDPPTPPDDRKTGGSDPSGPVSDGIVEVNEDGDFIELDEDGIPLGRWVWDDDEELWILDEFPPLGNLEFPDTGEQGTTALYLIFAAALLAAAITLIIRKKYAL